MKTNKAKVVYDLFVTGYQSVGLEVLPSQTETAKLLVLMGYGSSNAKRKAKYIADVLRAGSNEFVLATHKISQCNKLTKGLIDLGYVVTITAKVEAYYF